MYSDKITLFNHYKSRLGDMWYPTVIDGVNLLIDKAAIVAKYGTESKDNAVLNIHYKKVGDKIFVDGREWLQPKEWKNQAGDRLSETITFASGSEFDFFMLGEYQTEGPIADDDFVEGFYNFVNNRFDYVFAVTSVGMYSTIPHFEITGA